MAAVLFLVVSPASLAGAWMRSGGEYSYTTGMGYVTHSRYFDSNSRPRPAPCTTRDAYFDQYLEYGYSYYHTIFAGLHTTRRSCGGDRRLDGGDLELGIRGRLNLFRNGRTWEAALLLPSGEGASGPSRPGVEHYGLELGLHGRFAAGGPFHAHRYFSTGAEVRLWEGVPSEHFLTYMEYSWPAGSLDLQAGLHGNFSLRNGADGIGWGSESPVDDYDRIRVRASLGQPLGGEWSVDYKVVRVVWGRNMDASTEVGISFGRTWME
ncbi:hypothetical protein [Thiohalorhabdus methylotrophus]|uniref:Cellulose biosynthesis protein BcsS n=1 Tax=Thiohalorhabdus methylotrophus TaxID=3242694 RepID=A0ABV4TRP6_9GAMM